MRPQPRQRRLVSLPVVPVPALSPSLQCPLFHHEHVDHCPPAVRRRPPPTTSMCSPPDGVTIGLHANAAANLLPQANQSTDEIVAVVPPELMSWHHYVQLPRVWVRVLRGCGRSFSACWKTACSTTLRMCTWP